MSNPLLTRRLLDEVQQLRIEIARLTAPPKTCATCIHYRPHRPEDADDTITCMRIGSPVLNAAPHFGCILWSAERE